MERDWMKQETSISELDTTILELDSLYRLIPIEEHRNKSIHNKDTHTVRTISISMLILTGISLDLSRVQLIQ